jgi:peroxiredoxin
METPELVKLHKEFQARGVEFVGLSTEDPNASAQKVRDFMTQYGVDYQIGWATREVALTLMDGKTTIPQSFIITRDGRLFRKIDGFHPRRTPADLRKALEEALL